MHFESSQESLYERDPAASLIRLINTGRDLLPLPGHGDTLARWRALADVAGQDLALAKLFEGHTDALAILAELQAPVPADGRVWGTWCAEPPTARVNFTPNNGSDVGFLSGTKAWCSGAETVTHALVSAWDAGGEACLVAVELRQQGVSVLKNVWQAVGMSASASHGVRFDHVRAQQVGGPNSYVQRPGFWHGGAGIAACWWGGASAIATMTRAFLKTNADPHAMAHLGATDVAVSQTAALLREAANWIDTDPSANAMQIAMRVRNAADATARQVIDHATRAVGAGPLCLDARFARLVADLPVFTRQCHAERDLAALGALVYEQESAAWTL